MKKRSKAKLIAIVAFATVLKSASTWADDVHAVPLMASASDPVLQGFVRVVNRSGEAGEVTIEAVDDAGMRYGPISLALAANQTTHFNSEDLEYGNTDKGLPHGLGLGEGQWRLELRSSLDFDVLSYMRHRGDGYLTSLHDLTPEVDGAHYAAFFNPASNDRQQSLLRLTNPSNEAAQVEISGLDDRGGSPGTSVALTLAPHSSRMLTATDLESGSAPGLSGALGDGTGKWRLRVRSDSALRVMSLLRSPTGHLSNLSSVPPPIVAGDLKAYRVFWFPIPTLPIGGQVGNEGFVRVINHSDREGMVEIRAHGLFPSMFYPRRIGLYPPGFGQFGEVATIELSVGAGSVVHFNSQDLIDGNASKGLPIGVGRSATMWQLQLRSDLDIEVLSYLRTSDGFVTSMHDLAPQAGQVHEVATLNPASNWRQRSLLALFNSRDDGANVKIAGVDDQGASPGSPVEFGLGEKEALLLWAEDLEVGRREYRHAGYQFEWYRGVFGALGDGAGKWRLQVESDVPIQVMSLMLSPTGHVTNLSSAPGVAMLDADPPLPSNPAVPSPGTAGIDIPDANLRRIVEAVLGKAEGASITPAEMATLTELDVGASSWIDSEGYALDVGDLTGLEAAVNLERLYLPSASAENLMPLAALTNLRVFSAESSEVEDISPLSDLSNLEVLNLADSYVEDISALAGLGNLAVLNLRYTDVTDLSPLAGLAKLRVVDVARLAGGFEFDHVDGRDFSWLANLTALVELTATAADVTPWVAGLPRLRKLEADLTDFAALSHLTDLEVLKTGAGIDLSPLSALTDLRVVGLYGGVSGDLAPLSALSNLVEIELSPERIDLDQYVGQIEDVSALSGLTRLAKVWLGNNRIQDLAPLVANPGLSRDDLVYVPRNPLTEESINQHVVALQNRGVIVHFRPTVQ